MMTTTCSMTTIKMLPMWKKEILIKKKKLEGFRCSNIFVKKWEAFKWWVNMQCECQGLLSFKLLLILLAWEDIHHSQGFLEPLLWDIIALILDVPKRLHNKPKIKKQKFIIVQEVDICKVAWYSIVGILRSTYLDHKMDSKCGTKQRLHENLGMKKQRSATKQTQNNVQLFID